MKKKILVFVIVLVIIVAGGGYLYWTQFRTIKGTAADYIIRQTETGEKIVENKKAGLTFKVPEGWTEEKLEGLEGSVIIYSPDTKFPASKNPPLKTGCVIEISLVYKKMNFEEIKEEINDIHFGLGVKSEEFAVEIINNKQILKNTFDTIEIGKGTTAYIPHKNKVYSIAAYSGPENEEQCLQNFYEFLKTVSYK